MPAQAQFDKDGRLVYDPDRRLEIRWGDLIGTVNAVEALATLLRRTEIELPEFDEWALRRWLPTAVLSDDDHPELQTLPDRAAAVDWLMTLRDHLRAELPWGARKR